MKSHSLGAGVLLAFALATTVAARADPPPATEPTNQLVIVSDGGMTYTNNMSFWRLHARAATEGFYLECELLTAIFSTNSVRTNLTGNANVPATNSPASRLERVIAETHVMIITRDSQIIGDHAVYYATNDLLYVTGELVITANAQGSMLSTNITFDRATGSFWVEGANTFIGTGLGLTNAPAKKTNAPPARK